MARRAFSGARKRPVTWGVGSAASSMTNAATGKKIWTTSITSVGAALERTIVRLRGSFICQLSLATAALDGFEIGLGIGLVTEQALTAGLTAVPGPLTDTDWDGWMWHQVGHVIAATATIADGVNGPGSTWRGEIDSKAMRKWDEDAMAVVGVIEVTELGTASVEFHAHTRMLLKQ